MGFVQSRGMLHAFSDKKFSKSHPSWMVLNCHPTIMTFYLNQIQREGFDVVEPLAGSHISVVRNERVPAKHIWKQNLGRTCLFEYIPRVETNGKHWWLPVRSTDLSDFRLSIGLKEQPRHPFHLTVAVKAESKGIVKKPISKEAQREIELLEAMALALPLEIWEMSLEKKKLETLKERYF